MRLVVLSLVLFTSSSFTTAQTSQDSTSVSTEYTNDDTFQNTILDVTNLYRRQHNASQLAWNNTLAEQAKDWSEDCKFEHSGGPSGENLASGYPNVTASVEAWGDEREEYDFDKGDFSYAYILELLTIWTSGLADMAVDPKQDISHNSSGAIQRPLVVRGQNATAGRKAARAMRRDGTSSTKSSTFG